MVRLPGQRHEVEIEGLGSASHRQAAVGKPVATRNATSRWVGATGPRTEPSPTPCRRRSEAASDAVSVPGARRATVRPGRATLIASLIAIPVALRLALRAGRGRFLAVTVVNTGLALPPVVVGLVVTVLLWRSGPLGSLGLLYTPTAMVIAQAIIAVPPIVALSLAALQGLDRDLVLQLRALGGQGVRLASVLAREARIGVLAAVLAGFGAAMSEVGAALMVGGNIRGETRVLTTATVLATSRGQLGLALAFGLILLAVAFIVTLTVTFVQQRGVETR